MRTTLKIEISKTPPIAAARGRIEEAGECISEALRRYPASEQDTQTAHRFARAALHLLQMSDDLLAAAQQSLPPRTDTTTKRML